MLRHLPPVIDPNVLVGTDTRDDGGVYRLDAANGIIATTDFFTPVVDNPYDFGRIAAANALSDVWAMGGRPLIALNLVGFPARELPMEILGEILRGGADKVSEAGASLIGGHSIDDKEPKYGLAVVGHVDPDKIHRNVGARPGDALVLTKPLGSGIMTTAIKRQQASDEDIHTVTELMARLNRTAGEIFASRHADIHALTDITGFGLLGHLLEMLEASEVGATLKRAAIPILPAATTFARDGIIPGGTRANLESVQDRVDFSRDLESWEHLVLADAQTSGGLLAAVRPQAIEGVIEELTARGTMSAAIIGEVTDGPARVTVT